MRHASNKSIVKWGDHAGDAVLASRLLDGLPRSYPLAIKRKFYRLKNKVKSGKGTERRFLDYDQSDGEMPMVK